METSIFLEQSDTILQLAKLNKYLIELLARHTDVSADEKMLASIIQEKSHLQW